MSAPTAAMTAPPGGVDPWVLENHLGGAAAANYRRFELDLVSPYCGRRILEVGSGLGEFAAGLRGYDHLTVSDTDAFCLRALRERFAGRPDVDVIALDVTESAPAGLDASDRDTAGSEPDGCGTGVAAGHTTGCSPHAPDGPHAPGSPRGSGSPGGPGGLAVPVDTLIMMNVLEHVDDDVAALRRLGRLVSPGGQVVLWVPAYPALYGEFDRMVGHVRRYTPTTLRTRVQRAGLRVQRLEPVNLLGGIAWWAAVRCAGRRSADPRLVGVYDRIVVPATRFIERRTKVPFGQSLLCVAVRPAT
ncbi:MULTISPECIES: bifunctional 2-polyprenyl-6-hydroxyphenol methylase/3-demethylubiquinol 3-O-methyltransferase UbiG [Protofrankia]|uniref:class I SAM-dependent methyltransferase n=1 Tax=Protofrankia TaxID=2994361 RepID=UPI00069C5034|nr:MULTISPECIES: methyltransferase domain-containing protein [Protofrankia]ONH38108.1 hypothetical protein BL254_01415 [Protofrankia sp. BMG5.30]